MLYWNTVSARLKTTLQKLMKSDVLRTHRLVGGTALSLYLGHRMSVDIDLFTDEQYGTVNYEAIESYLEEAFPYISGDFGGDPAFGKSYLVGENKDDVIKVDIYYSSEPFMHAPVLSDEIRLAAIEDIIAMKVDVVQRGGRKKDFWDLHELLPDYGINTMIELHAHVFQWTHDRELIMKNFTQFGAADDDFDPICLRGKEWVFIKEDIEEAVELAR